MPTQQYTVEETAGYPPRIGKAVWRMIDCRRRTLEALEGIDNTHLDALPPGFDNTIGSVLYHLAAIEADWLYQDILGIDYPEWLEEVFPIDVRDDTGHLGRVTGITLADHLQRLDAVRGHFFDEMKGLEPGYLDVPRKVDDHEVSPGWVLHHLRQHEAEHRGHIQAIRTALEAR